MPKKVIVIDGYLASGKSTFALRLSSALQIPCLIKDTFKIALCQHATVSSRSESSLFSAVTFDAMMYVMERMFETGQAIIIEGNFVPAGVKPVDEAGTIRRLIERYGYACLTFQFSGDTRVLHHRFVAREMTDERGDVNKIGEDVPYPVFDQWCRQLDPFDVGGTTIRVDTTDFSAVDFSAHMDYARQFLAKP